MLHLACTYEAHPTSAHTYVSLYIIIHAQIFEMRYPPLCAALNLNTTHNHCCTRGSHNYGSIPAQARKVLGNQIGVVADCCFVLAHLGPRSALGIKALNR